jgi:hypothetical protein
MRPCRLPWSTLIYLSMDGRELQERIRAIRIEIAAIQDSEAMYRSATSHSEVEKAAHRARREALEKIKLELSALFKRKSQ